MMLNCARQARAVHMSTDRDERCDVDQTQVCANKVRAARERPMISWLAALSKIQSRAVREQKESTLRT